MTERIKLYADLGNRSTAVSARYGNGAMLTRSIASKILVEPMVYTASEMLDTARCSYINLHSGSQADAWGSRTIVLGDVNGSNATPVYRFGSSATAKVAASIFMLAAALEPREGVTDFEAEEVWVMHPRPTEAILGHFRKILGGMHAFDRNGVYMTLTIPAENVFLVPEGVSGYYEAVYQGLVKADSLNGYLDIGGMTLEFGFMNSNGVVPGSRSSIEYGVQAMASRIATGMKARGMTRKDPDTSLVLDGLLNAASMQPTAEHRYLYGAGKNAVSFDALVAPSKQAWVMELFGKFGELFSGIDDSDYSTTALIGGGALYIPPKALEVLEANGYNMAVPKQPEMANVNGLIRLSDRDFVKSIGLPTVELDNGILIPRFAYA